MIRPFKHPKTGMYWLRDRAPADVKAAAKGQVVFVEVAGRASQHRIGTELKVSLRTKEPVEARLRATAVETQFNTIWDGFRHPPRKLTHKEVQALAGEVYREMVAANEDEPGVPEAWETLSRLAKAPLVLGSGLQIGQPVPHIEPYALPPGTLGRAMARQGLMRITNESASAVLNATIKIMGEAADRLAKNARGDYSRDTRAEQFPIVDFGSRVVPQAAPSVTLTGLADNWASRKAKPDARTIKRYKGIIKSLVAYLGHDDATRLTDADIVRWHGELLESGDVSHQTFVKSYRAAISTVYAYAMSPQGGKKIDHNPAGRLLLEGPKRTINRPPYFTVDEARMILRASLAAAGKPGSKVAPHHVRAMRWVPWLGAYIGARPGELCQLRKEDFLVVDDVKCVALLPDAGTIKTGKFRYVPLHPHLLEEGVWEFAKGSPEGALFYDRSLTSGRPWENTSAFLSEWVRKDVGVTDPEVMPGHGWRHWFVAKAHTAGLMDGAIEAICGHAPASEGRKYGGWEPAALLREVSKLPRIVVE